VLQQPVIGIVFQLHGENQKSVALYNATKQKKLEKASVETSSREVAEALKVYSWMWVHPQ